MIGLNVLWHQVHYCWFAQYITTQKCCHETLSYDLLGVVI